jgi:hypothetical protein
MVLPLKTRGWVRSIEQAAVGILTLAAVAGVAQQFRFDSAGGRFGFGSNLSSWEFRQAEACVDWDLPWRSDLGKNWKLQTRLDLSAGWLGEAGDRGHESFVGTVGPFLFLGNGHFPLFLEAGASPTFLTQYEFLTKNFGIPFQFTSYLGVGLDIAARVRISYRFQHMSNAGLSSENPGLNMHMFGLSYIF